MLLLIVLMVEVLLDKLLRKTVACIVAKYVLGPGSTLPALLKEGFTGVRTRSTTDKMRLNLS